MLGTMQTGRIASLALDDREFFRRMVTVMAAVQVAGFVVHLAAGRSSFAAPTIVHVHAVLAMGWVALFAAQGWLAAAGNKAMHRTLGSIALAWAVAFVAASVLVTVAAVRTQRVPAFFDARHFLVADPAGALAFLALLLVAVARRGTDWHPRLQVGAFVMVMGPGFGRLLPLPFLGPYAFEIAALPALGFLAWGALRDRRVAGRIHPAWVVPVVTLAIVLLAARLVGASPLGASMHRAAAGTATGGPAATLESPCSSSPCP
jgi:hypothetical protein